MPASSRAAGRARRNADPVAPRSAQIDDDVSADDRRFRNSQAQAGDVGGPDSQTNRCALDGVNVFRSNEIIARGEPLNRKCSIHIHRGVTVKAGPEPWADARRDETAAQWHVQSNS